MLTNEEMMEYSVNDIMFYQKCPPVGSDSGSSEMCGTNQNYAGEQVFTDENMKAIEANKPFYEKAASQYGFPWQLLAVIHLRESGLRRINPNSEGVYQFHSEALRNSCSGGIFTPGKISDEQFQIQTNCAAEAIKNTYGAGLDLTTDDGIKTMLYHYNSGPAGSAAYERQAMNLGFSQEEAKRGEGSPYVMNRYDKKREPSDSWGQITSNGGSIQYPANNDFGAYVYYKAITCDGSKNDTGNTTKESSGDSRVSTKVSSTSVGSSGASSNAKKLSDTALELAWPKGTDPSKYRASTGAPTDAIKKAWKELGTYDKNIGHTDCGYFVQTVVAYSNVDPGFTKAYGGSHTFALHKWVKEHPESWEIIDFTDGDTSKLQAGDVLDMPGHIEMIADIDGELYEVEAQHEGGTWGHVSNKLKKSLKMSPPGEQVIYRAKGGSPACNACAKGSMNINGAAACLAWPLGTEESVYAWPNGKPNDSFQKAIDTVYKDRSWNECSRAGASCDVFAGTVVRWSGVDPDFPRGIGEGAGDQTGYARSHPDKWEVIEWNGDESVLQAGDVLNVYNPLGHAYVVVQDQNGKFYRAEGGLCRVFGNIQEGLDVREDNYILRAKNAKNSTSGVSVTDGVKTSSLTGKISGGTGQNSGDISATAFNLAWPEGTSSSTYTTTPTDNWVEAYNSLPGRKNTGDASNWRDGRSCMVFVNTVLLYAGALDSTKHDKDSSATPAILDSGEWEEVGGEGSVGVTYGDLEPGDVLTYYSNSKPADGETVFNGLGLQHEELYVEDSNGKGKIIQADFLKTYGHVSRDAKSKDSTVATRAMPIARVFRWKKQGDDCNVCDGGDDSGGGQLKEGGYDNVEDAQFIIDEYHKTWKDDKPHFGDVCDEGIAFNGSPHANCTNFSMWFAYHYMGRTDLAGKGVNGSLVANKIYDVCHGKFNKIKKSSHPTVYSIASWGGGPFSNHTAVVIGINKAKNKIIFADAAWCDQDGSIWDDNLSKYDGVGTYVDISDYVTGLKK